jgi:hypothetical protein
MSREGLSAFEIARRYAHFTDEREWLKSLRGPRGEEGRPGQTVIGATGAPGKPGTRGLQGPIGPMPRHEWKGTELRFEMEPGEWGKFVDLKGPPGDGGKTVVVGGPAAPLTVISWFPVII